MQRLKRHFLRWVLVALLVNSTAGQAQRIEVKAVAAIGITVSDLDRSVEFYSTVLSFEKESETEVWGPEYEHLYGVFGVRMRVARLRLGEEFIDLIEYLAPKGRPYPAESRSNDRWFQHMAIVVSNMEETYRRLRHCKVEHISPGPQRLPDWNPNASGIEAFYFKDPDGHVLEVLHFPPGKGDARWHRPARNLFLGIDHTAIVVGDTEESLKFYRDLLGMRVVGESENYGPEQERLNSVFGARLRITSLRALEGPGIEFLEYLSPTTGRPMPRDAEANDLLHWQTTLLAPDVAHSTEVLLARRVPLVSSGLNIFPAAGLGFHKAILFRDPDGHAIQIIER